MLSSNFPCRCLQLLKISDLLLRLAVVGENMIIYFSFRHNLHIPEVGLKVLALESILQVMVKGAPWSYSFHTWEESRVPGW